MLNGHRSNGETFPLMERTIHWTKLIEQLVKGPLGEVRLLPKPEACFISPHCLRRALLLFSPPVFTKTTHFNIYASEIHKDEHANTSTPICPQYKDSALFTLLHLNFQDGSCRGHISVRIIFDAIPRTISFLILEISQLLFTK